MDKEELMNKEFIETTIKCTSSMIFFFAKFMNVQ